MFVKLAKAARVCCQTALMMFASYRTHVIKLIENKDLIAQISRLSLGQYLSTRLFGRFGWLLDIIKLKAVLLSC